MRDSERYSYFQAPEGARRSALDQIPAGSVVLDVGCWSGFNGRYLVERGCTMLGIEPDRDAAEMVTGYKQVHVGTIEEDESLHWARSKGPFDAILFMDVLEHLENPASVLLSVIPLLSSEAMVVASIPNVAYWGMRYQLLKGRWDYEDSGILDRTHLRFFTIKTAEALLKDAGLRIEWSDHSFEKVPVIKRWPRLERKVASRFPELFAVQSLFVAKPGR